uniref:Uncharacterized protein n=1 Tax=Davidia involucrata TaxID=16924 RepID=A0A5B7BBJ5_DAVIN
MASSSKNDQTVNMPSLISTPIHDRDQCTSRIGNWITTDSECEASLSLYICVCMSTEKKDLFFSLSLSNLYMYLCFGQLWVDNGGEVRERTKGIWLLLWSLR